MVLFIRAVGAFRVLVELERLDSELAHSPFLVVLASRTMLL